MDSINDAHFTESELEELTDLYNAMLTMRDSTEMHKFFVDLCSINELHSFLHRWQIVRRIEQGTRGMIDLASAEASMRLTSAVSE